MRQHTIPWVLVATRYAVLGDAYRLYLKGHYPVVVIGTSGVGHPGSALRQPLTGDAPPAVLLVDDTWQRDPIALVTALQPQVSTIGLLYVDAAPNIFRVLHPLESGYRGYLYLGDPLADTLVQAVDHVRRGERFLSPTIHNLYNRYISYRGLFESLPVGLVQILKLMGEGLTLPQLVDRAGLKPAVVYRRQYRLRQHFGVATNAELVQLLHDLFDDLPSSRPAIHWRQ